jgi:hypothetical protein
MGMSFYKKVKIPEAYARVEWCKQTLGNESHGVTWWRRRGLLYFADEKCYTWYMLRWS